MKGIFYTPYYYLNLEQRCQARPVSLLNLSQLHTLIFTMTRISSLCSLTGHLIEREWFMVN